MIRDNAAKILWISDIHFSENYERLEESELTGYLTKFIQRVENQHEPGNPFDYIFLTGDIAQAGTREDYKVFNKLFLYPLLNRFLELKDTRRLPIPLLVVIPGNHDVKWGNTRFLKTYLDKVDPAVDRRADPTDYLTDHVADFTNLFNDYSDFLDELKRHSRYKVFFEREDAESIIISDSYRQNGLFGYIIDKRHRLFIILINSAWYSQGANFAGMLAMRQIFDSELYDAVEKVKAWRMENQAKYSEMAEYFTGISDSQPWCGPHLSKSKEKGASAPDEIIRLYDHFKAVFDKIDYLTEYSNQITACRLLEFQQWREELDNYKDYCIISCMHHPLNWLRWDEQYAHNADATQSASILREILKASDLLITGHEHLPVDTERGMAGDTIHLKGGCFLNDNQHKRINLSHCWYSVLSLDNIKPVVWHERFSYKKAAGYVENSWMPVGRMQAIPLSKKNDRFKLTAPRKNEVTSYLNLVDNKKLETYFRNRKWIEGDGALIEIEKRESHSILEHHSTGGANRLLIFARSTAFYKEISQPGYLGLLNSFLQLRPGLVDQRVLFVVPDIFVNESLTKLYESEQHCRSDIRDRIVKAADVKFDEFRCNFYLQFEPILPGDPLPGLNNLKSLQHLKFVNVVIPYYDIHPYMFES